MRCFSMKVSKFQEFLWVSVFVLYLMNQSTVSLIFTTIHPLSDVNKEVITLIKQPLKNRVST